MSVRSPSDLLELLFTASDDAIIGLDPAGLVDAWNPAAARLLGWTTEEVLGSPPPQGVLPAWTPGFRRAHAKARAGNKVEMDLRVTEREAGGVLIMATDRTSISRREKASSEQLRHEGRFRELLEAAPDAIIEVDRDGNILTVNRVAESLFGYSRAQMLGMNVDMLVPDSLRAGHAAHRGKYWHTPETRPMGGNLELSARRSDGSSIPVEISLSPVITEDSMRVTAVIRDVTERRIAEERIHAAHEELAERNRLIQRADRLKSEFLASMSHELRTPLHTIIGFTELLAEELEGPLNEKQKRFVTHVHKDSVHLLELINDILDLSKIEAGRLDLAIGRVSAHEVLEDTLSGITRVASVKRIRIVNQVHGPVLVSADPVRLREIFSNLLNNAIKFTPEHGCVTINAEQTPNGMMRFSIRDTGIGIAPEDQQVIFEKFRQVATSTRGVREGTGLGLAIVKHLVEKHGGAVELDSAPGKGSCFRFTIPFLPQLSGTVPVMLIVEDDEDAREAIARYLSQAGIASECALSPAGAVLLAKQLRPAAIALDLLMPGRSGWRVLRELRSTPETREIPVFVMSVRERDQEALALGATDYLRKPVDKEALLRMLRTHVPALFASPR